MRTPTVLVALTLVLGCGDDGGSDSDSTGSGTESTSSDTTTSTSEGTSSATSASTSSDASTDPSTSSASTTTTTGGSTSDSAGTGTTTDSATSGAGLCEPTNDDGECYTCVKSNCCQAWTLCQNDESCACILDCHVVQGNSLGMCRSTCGDSMLYNGVYFCGQMSCLGLCDWSSP
jgi:hypothetical protein